MNKNIYLGPSVDLGIEVKDGMVHFKSSYEGFETLVVIKDFTLEKSH